MQLQRRLAGHRAVCEDGGGYLGNGFREGRWAAVFQILRLSFPMLPSSKMSISTRERQYCAIAENPPISIKFPEEFIITNR